MCQNCIDRSDGWKIEIFGMEFSGHATLGLVICAWCPVYRARQQVHSCRVPDLDTRIYIEFVCVVYRYRLQRGNTAVESGRVWTGFRDRPDPHPTNPFSNSKTGHNAEWLKFKILWCAKARLCNYSLCSPARLRSSTVPTRPTSAN